MEALVHQQRRPLQPKNIQCDRPKPKPIKFGANAGRENDPFEAMNGPSLAEELSIVRRRREKLRSERERTQRWLGEKERVLEVGLREMERRWEEQRKIELEIERFVLIMELESFVRVVGPFQSLRAREEEKRGAPLKESNCAGAGRKGSEQPSMQEKEADN